MLFGSRFLDRSGREKNRRKALSYKSNGQLRQRQHQQQQPPSLRCKILSLDCWVAPLIRRSISFSFTPTLFSRNLASTISEKIMTPYLEELVPAERTRNKYLPSFLSCFLFFSPRKWFNAAIHCNRIKNKPHSTRDTTWKLRWSFDLSLYIYMTINDHVNI